jgi:phosphatidylinositol 4-kinase A
MVRAWAQSRSHGITINSAGLWHSTTYYDEAYHLFQKYLAVNQSLSPIDAVDLGASIAETYGKAIGPVQRKLCTTHLIFLFLFIDYAIASLVALSKHKPDRAKVVISQIASTAYFTGEIAGLRLAGRGG